MWCRLPCQWRQDTGQWLSCTLRQCGSCQLAQRSRQLRTGLQHAGQSGSGSFLRWTLLIFRCFFLLRFHRTKSTQISIISRFALLQRCRCLTCAGAAQADTLRACGAVFIVGGADTQADGGVACPSNAAAASLSSAATLFATHRSAARGTECQQLDTTLDPANPHVLLHVMQ